MQEVFKDGRLGDVKDFELELMKKLIKQENVDHVRVFAKEGNKVGIENIISKQLEEKIDRMIDTKLDEREMKTKLLQDYKELTGEGLISSK